MDSHDRRLTTVLLSRKRTSQTEGRNTNHKWLFHYMLLFYWECVESTTRRDEKPSKKEIFAVFFSFSFSVDRLSHQLLPQLTVVSVAFVCFKSWSPRIAHIHSLVTASHSDSHSMRSNWVSVGLFVWISFPLVLERKNFVSFVCTAKEEERWNTLKHTHINTAETHKQEWSEWWILFVQLFVYSSR